MLKLELTITAETREDIIAELKETVKSVEEGCTKSSFGGENVESELKVLDISE